MEKFNKGTTLNVSFSVEFHELCSVISNVSGFRLMRKWHFFSSTLSRSPSGASLSPAVIKLIIEIIV